MPLYPPSGAGAGMAIGGAVTGGSAGSMLFVDAGVLAQDGAVTFDNTDKQLVLGAGSASKPSLSVSDDGLGLYRSALNALSIATAGVGRWTVDASGHIVAVTNNTYDIGDSGGAARPRDVNAARNLNFGTALKISGSDVVVTGSTPTRVVFSGRSGTVSSAELMGRMGAADTSDPDVRLNSLNTRTAGFLAHVLNNGTRKWGIKFDARVFEGVPNSAPTDADLQNSEISWYLDEATPAVKARIKKSDGTLLTLTITNGASPTLA